MKKYIFGLALMAGFALTSCDTDNEGAIYNPSYQNISFETANPAQVVVKGASTEVTVRLIRSNAAEAYTAHYTLTSEADGVFSDANGGQVTFNAGSTEAFVTINANNMQGGNVYNATLTLSDADQAQADPTTGSATTATKLSVKCDWNWIELGKGHYTSPEWWQEDYDVDIVYAEGSSPKLYKILGLFAPGYDIEFTITDDNEVYVADQASWKDSSYGTVYLFGYANEDESGYAGPYDPETKIATMTLFHYVSVGSFGAFTDTLQMP